MSMGVKTPDEVVIKMAKYIISTRNDFTATGKVFNMAGLSVKRVIYRYLPNLDAKLFEKVDKIIIDNLKNRYCPNRTWSDKRKDESIKKIDDFIYKTIVSSNEEMVQITYADIIKGAKVGEGTIYRRLESVLNNSFCRFERIGVKRGNAIDYYYKLKPIKK